MQQDLYNINQYDVNRYDVNQYDVREYDENRYDVSSVQTNNGWVFVGLIYAFIAIGIFLFPVIRSIIYGSWWELMYYLFPYGWIVALVAIFFDGYINEIDTPLAKFTSKFLSKIQCVGMGHLSLLILLALVCLPVAIIFLIIEPFVDGSYDHLLSIGGAAAVIILANKIESRKSKFRKE